MFKVFATNVVVSKGYESNPALKFFGNGDSCVQFRVGEKVYDTSAENNTRWVNHSVKAFGDVCERIKKMQIKEGSLINFSGTLMEEVWTEGEGENKKKKSTQVVVLSDIEYASGGGKKPANDGKTQDSSQKKEATETTGKDGNSPDQSENFTGFGPFGGGSFFDD